KYLVELVGRVDGSYIFSEAERFGFFPGVSLAWRASEETFWKNHVSFIPEFKIRVSYGVTGNDRIAPYQYLTTYAFSSRTENQVFDVDKESKSLYASRIPNSNVSWEVAKQGNIGFDAYFLQNK